MLAHVSRSVVSEGRLALPLRATLVAYTDGMVERRDRVIDEGIERLRAALHAADPGLTASALADGLIRDVAAVTDADDDIALLRDAVRRRPRQRRHRARIIEAAAVRETREAGARGGSWLAASTRARATGRCGTSTRRCSRTTTRWSRWGCASTSGSTAARCASPWTRASPAPPEPRVQTNSVLKPLLREEPGHLRCVRAGGEALRGLESPGQQLEVSGAVEEHRGLAEHPVHRESISS